MGFSSLLWHGPSSKQCISWVTALQVLTCVSFDLFMRPFRPGVIDKVFGSGFLEFFCFLNLSKKASGLAAWDIWSKLGKVSFLDSSIMYALSVTLCGVCLLQATQI